MDFNWEEFLTKEFPKGKIIKGRRGRELNIDCISNVCSNPRKHMFVNLGSENSKHDRRFVCHRCGVRGNHVAFLMNYYQLPIEDILVNLKDLYGYEGSPYDRTKGFASRMRSDLNIGKLTLKDSSFKIDLPREFKPLIRPNGFCRRRSITKQMIDVFGIGRCKTGFYKERIIFPVVTGMNRSFVAYSPLGKKSLERYKELSKMHPDNKAFKMRAKKMINPVGSLSSYLLYNYNNVSKGSDIVFIHEGITDCTRTFQHGYDAMGLLKKSISDEQVRLLANKSPKEVCIMLDSDASGKDIREVRNALREGCTSKVSFVTLEEGDPHDIKTKRKFESIIAERKYLSYKFERKLLK